MYNNTIITEKLKKINKFLKGATFLSLSLSFLVLILFLSYKIFFLNFSKKNNFFYQESKFNYNKEELKKKDYFVYASKKGKKYYFYNCKSSIKEENRIYFKTEQEVKNLGYILAKTCLLK